MHRIRLKMNHRISPESLLRKSDGDRCITCGRFRQDVCLTREVQFHPELNLGEIELEPRRSIYAAGDEAVCLCVVRSGYVKLVALPGSEEMAMRIAGPCSLLGLNAALCQGTHDVSTESLTRVNLRPINRSELIHLIRVSEGIRRCILFALSSELRSYSDGLRRIGLNQTVAGRLSSFLFHLSVERGEGVEGRFRFPLVLSQDKLASMIGTTRKPVTRTLGKFKKNG